MVTGRHRGRGQMILIGALALAVLIIGLSVVANSGYVTDVDTTSQVSPQIDEAQEFEYESNKGVRSLILRLNHRHRTVADDKLGSLVGRNVTVYSQLLAESYTSSHGHYVDVTYNNGSSGYGSRVVQAADSHVTDEANDSDWYVGRDSEYRELGWFSMNVDLERTGPEPTSITVSNASGNQVTFTINRTDTGNGTKLRVASTVSHAGDTTALCDPSRNRVLLDFVDGETFTGDCTFNGTNAVGGPVDIEITGGENVIGKYELVYNESVGSSPYSDCDSSPTPDATEPCAAPVVWEANVTTQFAGSQLNYTNTFNVSVYEETS